MKILVELSIPGTKYQPPVYWTDLAMLTRLKVILEIKFLEVEKVKLVMMS